MSFLTLHADAEFSSKLPEKSPVASLFRKNESASLTKRDSDENKDFKRGFVLKTLYLVGSKNSLSKLASQRDGIYFSDLFVPGYEDSLSEVVSPYMGESLNSQDIVDLKRDIILYYRSQNYPLVTVQIPEQDVTQGTLGVLIIPSTLGEICVKGNKHFSSSQYLDPIRLQNGQRINEKVLLNDLNFLNRNTFRRADLIYSPGNDLYTTNIEILARDEYPLNVYAGVDNTGLAHTDRIRWFSGFTWGNVFNLAHTFSFQYTAAPQVHKFYAFTLNYTAPLSIQHVLRVYGGYSHVKIHLPFESKTKGQSYQASIRYDIPFTPSPSVLHEFLLGFDFKRSNNNVEFVEDFPLIAQQVNLTQFLAGYNLGYEKGCHKLGFDLQAIASPFTWLPDQSSDDFKGLNPFAKHTYFYARSSLNYKVRMPMEFVGNFRFAGQVSAESLVPSEQFPLGGYSTVRGYTERQLNSDNGILLSGEIQSPKIGVFKRYCEKGRDAVEFLVFMDFGYGGNWHHLPGGRESDYLWSVGPGMRYAFRSYFSARLDWGVKLHRRDDFGGGNSMVHFSVIGSF
ncbi:MAG: ShlB/FhaC/HecB family hemolysin secretion/activation protein [Chlamydiota bacterium]